jgi:hypothetical protein
MITKKVEHYTLEDLMKILPELSPPNQETPYAVEFEDGIESTIKSYVDMEFPDNPQKSLIVEVCSLMMHVGILMAEDKYASPIEKILGPQTPPGPVEWRVINGIKVLARDVKSCGKPITIYCDANCKKAWGISQRPKIKLSDDEDDVVYMSDEELKNAPRLPDSSAGLQMKPQNKDEWLNKWCYRECERCGAFRKGEEFKGLKDWSVRRYNQPWKHPEE